MHVVRFLQINVLYERKKPFDLDDYRLAHSAGQYCDRYKSNDTSCAIFGDLDKDMMKK